MMIARSIIKMIEDSGGASPQIHAAVVRLPAAAFDQLRDDADQSEAVTELRVQGILFKRDGDGRKRRRSEK